MAFPTAAARSYADPDESASAHSWLVLRDGRSGQVEMESFVHAADVDAPPGETATLPSDFPIPAPANPVNMITAIPGTLTVDYEESRFNEVLQFYVDWMSEQEEAYSEPPADISAGGLWASLASEGEPGFGRSVTIGRGIGSDNRVGVVLGAPNG